MAKQYKIDLILNTQSADSAADKAAVKAARVEAAYDKTAKAAESALNKAAEAAEKGAARAAAASQKAADRAAASQQREGDRQSKEVERQVERWERAEARKATAKERAAAQIAAIESRYIARDLRDRTKYDAAKEDAAKKSHAAAIDSILAQSRGTDRVTGGQLGLTSAIGGTTLAYAGLHAASRVMSQLGDSLQEAADYQKTLTDEFIRYRDAQRESEAMQGKPVTSKSALEAAKFEAEVGMSPAESRAFRTAMLGSGEQFRGKSLDDTIKQASGETQFQEYQKGAARLAVATGIEPGVVGDLSGSMLGFKDYSKAGPDGAKNALRDLNKAIKILQHGKGANPVVVRQLSELGSATINEEEMAGAFTSAEDASIAVGAMAEFKPGSAARYVQSAIKAVRGFEDPKSKDFLAEAKVTPEDTLFQAVEKIGPKVKEEAKARGLKNIDVIREKFSGIQSQRAIEVLINKGIGPKGVIAERREFAKQFDDPKVVQKEIADAFNDPESAGARRLAEAQDKESKLKEGQKYNVTDTLRLQAEMRLRDKGVLKGPVPSAARFFRTALDPAKWFGYSASAETEDIDAQVISMLEMRAKAAGVDFEKATGLNVGIGPSGTNAALDKLPQRRRERLNKIVADLESAGLKNPLGAVSPEEAAAIKAKEAAAKGGVPLAMLEGGLGGVGGAATDAEAVAQLVAIKDVLTKIWENRPSKEVAVAAGPLPAPPPLNPRPPQPGGALRT
jgi:hypothetical protein